MIPKANGKPRKPGIPTIADRVVQASLKLEQTRAALDIMGKAFALLELLSESADSPPPSAR
jgi:hypothetical protein